MKVEVALLQRKEVGGRTTTWLGVIRGTTTTW